MPNWVFNTLDNYPKELHEKYKGEDTDIDFNKIIPEPEEITNTPSGGYNNLAKNIYRYKMYIEDINKEEDDNYRPMIQHDSRNPLRDEVKSKAEYTTLQMGELVIEDPDTPLNEILEKDDHKIEKSQYDSYVEIFGNNAYRNIKDFEKVYDNYINHSENTFSKLKENTNDYSEVYKQYDSLEDMGEKLIELQKKYGADNWYAWRNANWGTKWNACDSDYDDENESIHFDTAWSIPYPIIAKIAQDNPEVNLEGYSEEETGWFDEYNTKDGKVTITAEGKYQWDEDSDETKKVRNEIKPPKVFSYDEIAEGTKRDYETMVSMVDSMTNRMYHY